MEGNHTDGLTHILSIPHAFEEGRQKEKEEIAISMLQKGMELAVIAEITGLKYEELEAIKSVEK